MARRRVDEWTSRPGVALSRIRLRLSIPAPMRDTPQSTGVRQGASRAGGIRAHRLLSIAIAAMAAGVAWEFVRAATGVGGARLEAFSSQWVYTAVEAIAVLVCATRVAVRKQDRPAWLCMTLGLATWSVGDLLWTVWLDYVPNPPFPSIADAAYLLMYPAMYVALMLLIRSRLRHTGIAE